MESSVFSFFAALLICLEGAFPIVTLRLGGTPGERDERKAKKEKRKNKEAKEKTKKGRNKETKK